MHAEYTPEEVRKLIEEHEPLEYGSDTAADLTEATDVLEGVEKLIAKLDPAIRRETVESLNIPVGDQAWIPVANNCRRSAGVAVAVDGTLSFIVRGKDEEPTSYFAARQAAAHALSGVQPEADRPIVEQSPREELLVKLLKENGWAMAASRTLADIDGEVLAQAYRLSEQGIAHLFATEAGDGIVLAMAGSTDGDRRRAAENLPTLPARSYSSRPYSVLFDCGETGNHYSEQEGFGQTVKETPKPKEHLLEAVAERFKASRFIRPSTEKPFEVEAMRWRVRKIALVRAAVRYALAVDPTDAPEMVRRVVGAYVIGCYFSRKIVRRALAAERPWDSKAERSRMIQRGRAIRSEILSDRKARVGEQLVVTAAWELDAERCERLALPDKDSWDPKLRRSIEQRKESGRAAYDTARAVYLQRCPELEHKLLHLLRRDGVQAEAGFLSRHSNLAAEDTNPVGALHVALRALAEGGKARRVRSQKAGEIFLNATEPLDETGYRRSLNSLIRDERFGITNPWTRTGAVESEGDAEEWEGGLEDLDDDEFTRLAPRRFRNTDASEQSLLTVDQVADSSAIEEMEAVTEVIA